MGAMPYACVGMPNSCLRGISMGALARQRSLVSEIPILGPKSEALNPKSETMSNVQSNNSQNKIDPPEAVGVSHFDNLKFEFV